MKTLVAVIIMVSIAAHFMTQGIDTVTQITNNRAQVLADTLR